jgi:small redox-active disulfide protein 2
MTKTIKILGTGCPKCKTMTGIVQEVVAENTIDATVEKVEDIMEIMKYNVIMTPALVVDDVIIIKGRVPKKSEVLDVLTSKDYKKTHNSNSGCCS